MQLRFLQTVTEVAVENNSTTLFPIPIDLFAPFVKEQNPATPEGKARALKLAAEAAMASLAEGTDASGQIGDGDAQQLVKAGRALLEQTETQPVDGSEDDD